MTSSSIANAIGYSALSRPVAMAALLRNVRQLFGTKAKPDFGRYAIVRPGNVSPPLAVPERIVKPPYYYTGEPPPPPDAPEIKTAAQIARMRDSCRLAANILKAVGDMIKVGITTDEVDKFAHRLAIESDAYPSPLNYRRYPKSICTSVNNVACHGIPDDRPLADGDIVSVDVTVWYNGYHGDCAKTFLVGAVDERGARLVAAAERCVDEAVALCGPAARFDALGTCIERRAHALDCRVVPCFLGHGIGSYFHGAPDVLHVAHRSRARMAPGMTFTVEPVLTQGGARDVAVQADGWTALTLDDARTAQFEHTVLVTDSGVDVLTLPSV